MSRSEEKTKGIILYETTITLLSAAEWDDRNVDEMIRIIKPIQTQFAKRIEQILRLLGYDGFRVVAGKQEGGKF